MKASEEKQHVHDGCPYRNSCRKDEEYCCYLMKKSNGCYLNDEKCEDFV